MEKVFTVWKSVVNTVEVISGVFSLI